MLWYSVIKLRRREYDMINTDVKKSFIACADEDIRSGIAVSEYVRNESLNRAYGVEGYVDMPQDKRNAIYDAMRSEVIGELRNMGIAF